MKGNGGTLLGYSGRVADTIEAIRERRVLRERVWELIRTF